MKKSLLVMVVVGVAVLTSTMLSPPRGAAAQAHSSGVTYARYTIPAMGIYGKTIYYRNLELGPIWDVNYFNVRPGDGKTIVLGMHDVTPVPGYGAHGPGYNMPNVKKGDLASITWHGYIYTYRFAGKAFTKWQCAGKTLEIRKTRSMDVRRYDGSYVCPTNNRFIRNWGVETLYMRTCWPRGTDYQFHVLRATFVHKRKLR